MHPRFRSVDSVVKVERVPPGSTIVDLRAGDFLLVRTRGVAARLIGPVQALRFRGEADRPFRHWTHTALVTASNGRLVEVVEDGVRAQSIRKYDGVEYHYVRLEATEAVRAAAVTFAESCVGQPYARGAFLALIIFAFTGWRPPVVPGASHHCVSLVAEALQRMAQRFDRHPIAMMPGDLAKHYGIRP
jgi:hypothetical protein